MEKSSIVIMVSPRLLHLLLLLCFSLVSASRLIHNPSSNDDDSTHYSEAYRRQLLANGLSVTPPMGWGRNVNSSRVRRIKNRVLGRVGRRIQEVVGVSQSGYGMGDLGVGHVNLHIGSLAIIVRASV
ncbi:hypothetical protein ACLOJK_017056 [Asimina triloba]